MWQDVMDKDRYVKPLTQTGKVWTCAIYWRQGGGLRYGGNAPIPASLFDNPRIGFIPAAV